MPVLKQRRVHIDLDGSNCGPAYKRVEVIVSAACDWDDDRLRREAAAYYDVPVQQVWLLRPVTQERCDHHAWCARGRGHLGLCSAGEAG